MARSLKNGVVKLQTVTHHPFEFSFDTPADRDALTVGKQVDQMLHEALRQGRHPNKLVIDLNPPKEPDPSIIE